MGSLPAGVVGPPNASRLRTNTAHIRRIPGGQVLLGAYLDVEHCVGKVTGAEASPI